MRFARFWTKFFPVFILILLNSQDALSEGCDPQRALSDLINLQPEGRIFDLGGDVNLAKLMEGFDSAEETRFELRLQNPQLENFPMPGIFVGSFAVSPTCTLHFDISLENMETFENFFGQNEIRKSGADLDKGKDFFELFADISQGARLGGQEPKRTSAESLLRQLNGIPGLIIRETPFCKIATIPENASILFTVSHNVGFGASITMEMFLSGDFRCCCPPTETVAPAPEPTPEEDTLLFTPGPTESEIGTGGGAGGASGEIQKNVTSHACMVATGSEPAFPSMAGSGFSFLQDVVIDDATPDAIGITTKAIDTVNLEFLDANGNRVLGGQSRRPDPPQIQSIFPRDLSGNILRDSAGNIVEIVLRSISRDRIELQIPSELGRISPVKQLTLFILRDSAAGGFKVEPNQVPGVGLICHLGF